MRRRVALASLIAVPLIVAGALRPAPAMACTGEVVPLEEVIRTADAIVVARIVAVGAEVAVDVPGSWTFEVEHVLAGTVGRRFTLSWPAAVSICDGFLGALGERVVMAVGAIGFFQQMHPYWLLETERDPALHAGARDDLDLLSARLGQRIPGTVDAGRDPVDHVPWSAAVLPAAVVLGGGVLVLGIAGWRWRRQRGGL